MPLKQTISAYLDDTNRAKGEWVTGTIAVLIFLSAVIFVVETYEVPDQLRLILNGLDWTILSIFAVEYLLRIWIAERWWAYVFSPYGLVDLIAICPFVLGFLDMRFVRLLRWLRVLRLARFLGDRAILGRFTAADTLAVVRIVSTLFAIIFIYAGIIFQVEQRYNPDTFTSFLDAAYFAVVTMTTVGYGDITPVSDAGRLCTILMILTGIALIPTQLGNLIRQILKVSQSLQIPCSNCGWSVHDPDARFCKRCGESLPAFDAAPQMSKSDRQDTITSTSMPFAPRPTVDLPESAWSKPTNSPRSSPHDAD
ncbi:ion transporter [Oscillatoria sp. CS-180]|uniref:ion transporter n=1 Tax=Oscillatoria sp. CS-180 TaxID=3021720 RepID=UPI00232CAD26|nr:ion transporter [Oscillatoria sp. CS-180]MDB9528894.1 ion transporter [Oscillatoria sp. CS-180]